MEAKIPSFDDMLSVNESVFFHIPYLSPVTTLLMVFVFLFVIMLGLVTTLSLVNHYRNENRRLNENNEKLNERLSSKNKEIEEMANKVTSLEKQLKLSAIQCTEFYNLLEESKKTINGADHVKQALFSRMIDHFNKLKTSTWFIGDQGTLFNDFDRIEALKEGLAEWARDVASINADIRNSITGEDNTADIIAAMKKAKENEPNESNQDVS